jgi:endonuclease-3
MTTNQRARPFSEANVTAQESAVKEVKINIREYGSIDHILLVLDRLDSIYGYDSAPEDSLSTGEPLDGLMLTLLSQNTNDRNRDMAYESLRSKLATWRDVAGASHFERTSLIKSAGLGDTKSARMKAILDRINSDFGDYTLVPMKDWEADSVREYLSNFHGIGPKTVACVMLFDLGLPAFPVDTHVARVSRRLGFAAENDTPMKIQLFLESIVPADRCKGGHLNIIEHGRHTCRARTPECSTCNLPDVCRYYLELGTQNE